MDISADLHELARCPVGLVSAGVKSILDIGRRVKTCLDRLSRVLIFIHRTLEYLVRCILGYPFRVFTQAVSA